MFVCLFVCFEESKILGFEVQNSAQGLRNSAIDWNPGAIISGAHNLWAPQIIWNSANPQNGIWYPRLSWIQPHMGQRLFQEPENNVLADKAIVRLRYPGRGLKRGGGGGVKTFFSWKKGKILTPDRITHKIATFWGKSTDNFALYLPLFAD